jgi:hypothetical protein
MPPALQAELPFGMEGDFFHGNQNLYTRAFCD